MDLENRMLRKKCLKEEEDNLKKKSTVRRCLHTDGSKIEMELKKSPTKLIIYYNIT